MGSCILKGELTGLAGTSVRKKRLGMVVRFGVSLLLR